MSTASSSIPILSPRRVYYSTLIHSISLIQIEYVHALIGIDEAGIIAFIEKEVKELDIDYRLTVRGWNGVQVIKIGRGQFLMPGLIDTHTHAPQYPNLGFGQQYELLDWLSNVTFPTEVKFEDPKYARRTYESVVQRVINSGTTTCCYYGTLHLTTKILASICHRKGQRAFVGKCCMDRNCATNYEEKSASQSITDTKDFINHVRTNCLSPTGITSPSGFLPTGPFPDLPDIPSPTSSNRGSFSSIERERPFSALTPISPSSPPATSSPGSGIRLNKSSRSPTSLVQPILTPRFAISCSDALLAGLGAMMAKDSTLMVQTHLAENPTEIEFTRELFPFANSYTAIYDHFDLLTSNTILAHCVHLEESEMDLIKLRNAGISHCPTSNFNLRSGTSRVGDMLDKGIKVSLGTDVSGGFGLGVLSALRQASVVSKTIAIQTRDFEYNPHLTPLPISASPPPSLPLAADFSGSTTILSPVPISISHPNRSRSESTTPTPLTKSASTTNNGTRKGLLGLPDKYFSTRHLSLETLFYLATMGGAEVCGLEKRIGNFRVGKEFDALWIKTGQKEVEPESKPSGDPEEEDEDDEESYYRYGSREELTGINPAMFVESTDSVEKLFEKFLFAGDDRNIAGVFVRGRCIGGSDPEC